MGKTVHDTVLVYLPEIVFHDTASRIVEKIRRNGLKPMSRQQVHLSPDQETAIAVGQRHGKPLILRVKIK